MPGIFWYKKINNKVCKAMMIWAALLCATPAAFAAGGGQPPKASSIDDPFALTMVIIMLILLLAIGLLAYVVLGAASYYYQREKEREQEKSDTPTAAIITTIMLLLFAAPVFAQDAGAVTTAVQSPASFGSLSATAFYSIVGVIGIELLVLFALLYQLRVFLAKEKRKQQLASNAATAQKPLVSIWAKLNKFKPVEQEAEMDLGHEYDGIRELDNRLPPWWLYGFYASIFFAVIYLWRYHVSHTAPLSAEELQIAMVQADEQKAEYLKKSANNVDENTVKLLTDAADISDGQKVFTQNCAACHGKAGEGIVGPNLTDGYWLHGGGIKDVFKTIKYGWAEKGMRSWKDDLSPVQIAHVASYIKSIHGSNPPNAKAQQGELFKEDNNNIKTDSATNKVAVVTNK